MSAGMNFKEQFQEYNRWRDGLIKVLTLYQRWMQGHELMTSENAQRIDDSLALLRSDQLTIAFVAEFSRGKSELINAIFFAEYGRRLLPSSAGRTTMCPNELLYDREEDRSYVRLLPIETRAEDRTIAAYKQQKHVWHEIELDLNSPAQMQEALLEVMRTKKVTVEEARRLGLYNPEMRQKKLANHDMVELPCWRHAIISFPHPLLKQGLTILDTPGLNALGSEPELTLNMIPKAQAVVFMLGADTGVTRSDMDMWKHHLQGFCQNGRNNMVVVLNKIDTLWDDLKGVQDVDESIRAQAYETATVLGVDQHNIFPVSAKKALIAKVKDDTDLLHASRLLELEAHLSDHLMSIRRQIVLDAIRYDIEHLLDTTEAQVASRSDDFRRQLSDLQGLTGEKRGMLMDMVRRTRDEQNAYLRNVESFQASRKVIGQQVRGMMDALNLDRIDQTISASRAEMLGRWTTVGLHNTMKTLFSTFHDAMREVQYQNEQTRRLVQAIYFKFREEHGLKAVSPKLFRIMKYSVELEKLNQEAEAFRRSPRSTLTEQGFLVKKFYVSIVSRARDIFYRANREADAWTRDVLTPLVQEIKAHKQAMEERLQNLKQVSDSKENLESKINEMESRLSIISKQLKELQGIRDYLNRQFDMGEELEAARPQESAVS